MPNVYVGACAISASTCCGSGISIPAVVARRQFKTAKYSALNASASAGTCGHECPPNNASEAACFLANLDPTATFFSFQTFDDNEKRSAENKKKLGYDPFAKVIHGSLDQRWNELQRLNESGAGIFVTVNETDGKGRKKKNIVRIRWSCGDPSMGSSRRRCGPAPHA
jgi:hypothetical protein